MNNFPSYLRMHWEHHLQWKEPGHPKTKDVIGLIEDMNACKDLYPDVLAVPHVLATDGFTNESCAIYEAIAYNKDVRKIVVWIIRNIVLNMLKDERITTEVKIRVASSMLRTTLKNDAVYRYAADSLVTNIYQLQIAILDVQLPF